MSQSLFKVMVVDDEEMARKMIMESISWSSLDMEIMADTGSALEALALMEDQTPDILFTDIKMPYMDGLEFSRIVKSKYPHIKIVILTAFKDFDYAQKSVSIGISSFLLKPVNRMELQETAMQLRKQIDEEKKKWFEYDHLKKVLTENREMLREKFLLELLEEDIYTEETEKQLDYYFSGQFVDYIQVTLLGSSVTVSDTVEEQKILQDMKSREFIQEYLNHDKRVEVLTDKDHHLILLSYAKEIQMSQLCESISRGIYQTSGIQMGFGIGNAYSSLNQIGESYKEALEALKYSAYSSEKPIVFYNDDLHMQNTKWKPEKSQIEDIKFYIKAGMSDELNTVLPQLYLDKEEKLISVEFARMLSITLLSSGVNTANEIGLPVESIFGAESNDFFTILTEDTAIGMRTKTCEYLNKLTDSISGFRSNKSKSVLWDVLQYIQKEVSNPELSLSKVAGVFHMNDSYLSRVFSRELGFSFSKYLMRLRMEKAIQLLAETNMKAYQIGEAVGIPDAYYFSSCFKKHTGKSIRDYKKEKLNNNAGTGMF